MFRAIPIATLALLVSSVGCDGAPADADPATKEARVAQPDEPAPAPIQPLGSTPPRQAADDPGPPAAPHVKEFDGDAPSQMGGVEGDAISEIDGRRGAAPDSAPARDIAPSNGGPAHPVGDPISEVDSADGDDLSEIGGRDGDEVSEIDDDGDEVSEIEEE